ncbi:hypothetical protein PtA15_7A408 [Puccinia triticina]|uniref:Uncharacterized protein n=1 Tax=Puccinia triticina TaxID=208348 RepID=A0ABY7CNR9_9BASI|nr:uncharacterized protein PtA15_7A408 [Puccinia triticina]WAQ86680.1 hypothetical protein PtA15_7A408 [Puccinia triticina]WAR56547.1 hypothetical protein PtB15_7B396 [Puccinia triticina]
MTVATVLLIELALIHRYPGAFHATANWIRKDKAATVTGRAALPTFDRSDNYRASQAMTINNERFGTLFER